ncbi:uncharacterized protein At1g76070-like [Triticum urartu]|uniref:Uncharacterized protein n=1 Tax=Triticum urartu TaxID=4572 RepID=A0A8R7Q2T5_TRIUA|nr:uncharacterized protein At1g76070-like [Triticum urartu]
MATSTSRDRGGYPPDSTRLRIGDDIAWADVGGVYDRDDSLKENTNPKCLLKAHNPSAPGQHHHHHHNGAASQRFSGNLKPTAAPIIGLSGKLGQGGARRTHQQHPPAMFPKKAKTGGGGRNPRPAVPEDEPSSPKVSCIGKVLSERERARRRPRPPPSERPPSGCCPGLGFLMRRSRSRKSAVESVDWSPPPPPPAARRREAKAAETEEAAPAPAPGLGGVMRFASGRRAADWAAQMEVDDCVAKSGPL